MMRLGTRASALARWQAERVQSRLEVPAELVLISTTGDEQQEIPLTETAGVGFFTKELEQALLTDQVDLAVHSLKDLPTRLAPGLALAAVPERAAVADVLLIHPEAADPEQPLGLAPGTVVGTSSNRRQFQLLALQRDLTFTVMRGNIPTRIAKVQAGNVGALVVAQAALDRLGEQIELGSLIRRDLTLQEMLPAPGQGALGIECRDNDTTTQGHLQSLHDPLLGMQVGTERELLHQLGGGCNAPLGALVIRLPDGSDQLEAVYFTPSGSHHIRTRVVGSEAAYLLRSALHDLSPLNDGLPADGPLSGLTVLNTRPRGRGQQLTRALLIAGASVWVQPAILTVTRKLDPEEQAAIASSGDYDLALFTSPAAVEHLCDAAGWGMHLAGPRPAVVVTMGQATTESVEEAGWKVAGHPRRGNTDSLLDFLDDRELLNPGCRVLYIRADEGRDDLPEALMEEGMEVDLVRPYRTLSVAHPPLPDAPKVDVITFSSPSTVESFLAVNPWRPGWTALAIGPTTRDTCEDRELQPIVMAEDPTPSGLVKALTKFMEYAR